MDTQEIGTLLGSILINSVVPLVFTFYLNYLLKKTSRLADIKKVDEQKKNMIILHSVSALCVTSEAICEALKNGKINGNIDNSLEKLEEINKEINEFLMEKATRE